jgi:hypothetical protein
VRLEPAALDREFEARAVLGRAAAVTEEKRLVDFLNVDAPLNRLDRIGDFEDAARGLLWIGKGAGGEVYFIRCPFLRARSLVGLSALVAANLAGESRLDIGEAHIIRPAAGVHLDRATADAMHKDFRGAAFAHLAEGVLIFTWHAPNSAKKILLRIRPSLN